MLYHAATSHETRTAAYNNQPGLAALVEIATNSSQQQHAVDTKLAAQSDRQAAIRSVEDVSGPSSRRVSNMHTCSTSSDTASGTRLAAVQLLKQLAEDKDIKPKLAVHLSEVCTHNSTRVLVVECSSVCCILHYLFCVRATKYGMCLKQTASKVEPLAQPYAYLCFRPTSHPSSTTILLQLLVNT